MFILSFAVSYGIITYAIGYGTEAGGRIPVRDQFGFLRGFKKDQSRNEVITSFKPDALTAIAQAGRGQYFKSQFAGPHLKQIVDEIQKLQKTQFETSFAMQYEDRFQIFLLVGILLLLLGFALPSHRQRQGPWMGRFATTQSKGREVI
jgi:Ca-activated chloride channel family protein